MKTMIKLVAVAVLIISSYPVQANRAEKDTPKKVNNVKKNAEVKKAGAAGQEKSRGRCATCW